MELGFGTDLLGETHDAQSGEFALRTKVQSAADVVRSATTVNAALPGPPAEPGVIAAGAYADVLLVDGDPLADIGVLSGQGEHFDLIARAWGDRGQQVGVSPGRGQRGGARSENSRAPLWAPAQCPAQALGRAGDGWCQRPATAPVKAWLPAVARPRTSCPRRTIEVPGGARRAKPHNAHSLVGRLALRRHKETHVGLSPEEEHDFAAIISELVRRRGGGIPWSIVVLSVVVVGIAVAVAVVLGVHHLASLFYGTFVVALAFGLSVTLVADRRDRPF